MRTPKILIAALIALAVVTCRGDDRPSLAYVLVIEGYDVTLTATADSEEVVATARMDNTSTDRNELRLAAIWCLFEWAKSNGDTPAQARERFAIIGDNLRGVRYTTFIRRKLPQEMRP